MLLVMPVEDKEVRRLTTIPGVGPMIATALAPLEPPPGAFRRGRDFAAWVTPSQHSSEGKKRLGAISKMGERTLRRVLIIGANSVVRKAIKLGTPSGCRIKLQSVTENR
jgi:transposase